MAIETITADSKPIYCWFGGSDCWTCNDLVTWHQQMTIKYGQSEANKRFIDSYTNDTPLICEQLDCRSFNSNFRSYFKTQGILSDLYNGIAIIAQPIGVVTDTANNASDVLSNVGSGAVNVAKTLKYVFPIAVIIAAIIGVAYAIKQLKLTT